MDQLRIMWSAAYVALGRPLLSRWHCDYRALFKECIREGREVNAESTDLTARTLCGLGHGYNHPSPHDIRTRYAPRSRRLYMGIDVETRCAKQRDADPRHHPACALDTTRGAPPHSRSRN
ncbi:hypothetical protein B0H10DRAFT_2238460 [Mycena sp. CBHHK59/15]|nr:hypothetical protein B0H10DRAFT_2238460 [Mycena sp. CBHHK59/15]